MPKMSPVAGRDLPVREGDPPVGERDLPVGEGDPQVAGKGLPGSEQALQDRVVEGARGQAPLHMGAPVDKIRRRLKELGAPI